MGIETPHGSMRERRPSHLLTDAILLLHRDGIGEVAELALGAAYVEPLPLVDDRDPGRVVAAVFELAQPVDDDGHDLFVADVSNDAAHDKNSDE